jgi:hypothetical protein
MHCSGPHVLKIFNYTIRYYTSITQIYLMKRNSFCVFHDHYVPEYFTGPMRISYQDIWEPIRLTKIRQSFLFPGVSAYIRTAIAACGPCQQKKNSTPADQRFYHRSREVGSKFQRISVDLIGPLPPSTDEPNVPPRRYVLTCLDDFTRYLVATPIINKKAETVARALERVWLCQYGIPDKIYSDNGKEFSNVLLQDFLSYTGCSHSFSLPYIPCSNCVERHHQSLERVLRTCIDSTQQDWTTHLPPAVFALNSAVSSAHGFSPFKLVYGQTANVPVTAMFGLPTNK